LRKMTIVSKCGQRREIPLPEVREVIFEFDESEAVGGFAIRPDAYGATVRFSTSEAPILGLDLFNQGQPKVLVYSDGKGDLGTIEHIEPIPDGDQV
jgi:hypothetical protein